MILNKITNDYLKVLIIKSQISKEKSP